MRALEEARGVAKFIWKHPANQDRRFRQLTRAARFQLGARLFGTRYQTQIGDKGGRIWVDLHRTAATKALYANPPDWPHMLVWRARLRAGTIFIDVGANIGTYSIMAASLGAEVIALEPAKDTAELLRENVALNGFSVDVIEAAAGREAGTTHFTAGQDCINQVDPSGDVIVPVVTLDSIIGERHVTGMKVDVEGFEFDVLLGCMRALQDHRIDLLQLEWNSAGDRAPVSRLMLDLGYRFFEPTDSGELEERHSLKTGADLFAAPINR